MRTKWAVLAALGYPMVVIIKVSLLLTIGPFVLLVWGVIVLARALRAQPMRQGHEQDDPAQRHLERMAAIDARHQARFGRTFGQAHYSDRR